MTRFSHVSVWVSRWKRTREFYVDGLGLSVKLAVTIDGIDNYLVGDDRSIGIQFKHDPDQTITPTALDYIALEVNDIDEVFERLVGRFGANIVSQPTWQEASGNKIAFVEDPEGYIVELVENEVTPIDE